MYKAIYRLALLCCWFAATAPASPQATPASADLKAAAPAGVQGQALEIPPAASGEGAVQAVPLPLPSEPADKEQQPKPAAGADKTATEAAKKPAATPKAQSKPVAAAGKKSAKNPRSAHIGYLYPAGATRGSEVEVLIGGDNIYGSSAVLVSHKGISGEIIDSSDPQAHLHPSERKRRRPEDPPIDQQVRVKLRVERNVPAGEYELALLSEQGLSNKRTFVVGELEEISKPALEQQISRKAAAAAMGNARRQLKKSERCEQQLSKLPLTLNGQIGPAEQHWYAFRAKAGMQLVARVQARRLNPYIADAVPGWFQALLELREVGGLTLASCDHAGFDQDAVLVYQIERDGDYQIGIRDAIWRGREDFVYRLQVGALPHVVSIQPPFVDLSNSRQQFSLQGYNLQVTRLDQPSLLKQARVFDDKLRLQLAQGALPVNSLSVAAWHGGVLEEQQLGKTARGTQQLAALPARVLGTIGSSGEIDRYEFSAQKGRKLSFEILSRRLGKQLDVALAILDNQGNLLASSDDAADAREGYLTHQADAALQWQAPQQGNYVLWVYDCQGQYGQQQQYLLLAGEQQADFAVRAEAANLYFQPNQTRILEVQVLPRGGFASEVELTLDEAAASLFELSPKSIAAGQQSCLLTLTRKPGVAVANCVIPKIFARARVNGKQLQREVVCVEDLMQAFLWRHLLPQRSLACLLDNSNAKLALFWKNPLPPLKIKPGAKISLSLCNTSSLPGNYPLRLSLVQPADGSCVLQTRAMPNNAEAAVVLQFSSQLKSKQRVQVLLQAELREDYTEFIPAASADKSKGAKNPQQDPQAKAANASKAQAQNLPRRRLQQANAAILEFEIE